MKSSNKIILSLILIIIAIILGFAILSRFFMDPNVSLAKAYAKPQTQIQGNGSGQHIKKIYPKINNLQIKGAFNVELKPGITTVLTIYSDENILQGIDTNLDADTLTVASNANSKISNDAPVRVILEAADVNSIVLIGKNHLNADFIQTKNFNLYSQGDNVIRLDGSLDMLNISLHGKNVLNASKLNSQTVNLDIHDNNVANIFAKNNITINATGANKITYFGNPESVVKTIDSNKTIVQSGEL